MIAGTVNSFTRLVPGFWAPTSATWGAENRTTALRVIGGGPKSQRVEHRVAAADINPYIALAAALGSGLWGIENQIEPTAPVVGNAYAQTFAPELAVPGHASRSGRAAEGVRGGGPVRRATSWTITPTPGSGRNASSAEPSPAGSWSAISRSSENPSPPWRGKAASRA